MVVALSVGLYSVPAGKEIRPMGLAFYCGLIAIASLAVIPLAIFFMVRRRCFLWPSLAILLALSPFPLAAAILHHAAHTNGFIIEE